MIGLALILVGTARAWEDVDTGNALFSVFVVGITGLFAALLARECAMVARERRQAVRVRPREACRRAGTTTGS